MNTGTIIQIIVVVIVLSLAIGVVRSIIASATPESEKRKKKLSIGSTWCKTDKDPWTQNSIVTIIDKKDGWVKYQDEFGEETIMIDYKFVLFYRLATKNGV